MLLYNVMYYALFLVGLRQFPSPHLVQIDLSVLTYR